MSRSDRLQDSIWWFLKEMSPSRRSFETMLGHSKRNLSFKILITDLTANLTQISNNISIPNQSLMIQPNSLKIKVNYKTKLCLLIARKILTTGGPLNSTLLLVREIFLCFEIIRIVNFPSHSISFRSFEIIRSVQKLFV